jgi:hypothetical protein
MVPGYRFVTFFLLAIVRPRLIAHPVLGSHPVSGSPVESNMCS